MRARAHVEAKLAPQDIDQVRVGQSAVLRFSAFNQGTTPELNGVVSRVWVDRQAPGTAPRPGNARRNIIKTGDRTILSYVTKPFKDQGALRAHLTPLLPSRARGDVNRGR
jgi:HlyD family secretion protein